MSPIALRQVPRNQGMPQIRGERGFFLARSCFFIYYGSMSVRILPQTSFLFTRTGHVPDRKLTQDTETSRRGVCAERVQGPEGCSVLFFRFFLLNAGGLRPFSPRPPCGHSAGMPKQEDS